MPAAEKTVQNTERRSRRIRLAAVFASVLGATLLWTVSSPRAGGFGALDAWLGQNDGVLVTDTQGLEVYARHADLPLVPASTLKLLTALVSRHELGAGHRFCTEFYLTEDRHLKIKGYGDPLLISEEVDRIAGILSATLTEIEDIVADDSYFQNPLTIPGVNDSLQPYDAPNGALCVNFNSVAFRSSGGAFVSGEPETPLLPMVLDRIRSSGLKRGRIPLSREKGETARYAGALFAHFLQRRGVRVRGGICNGNVDPKRDRLIYRHHSRYSMDEAIGKMLEYSNNFIANQLLLASGARRYGPPGDLEKGARTAAAYAREQLGLESIRIVEGSGISRKNRISARQLMAVLQAFEPHRHLLTREDGDAFKTGTLRGVRSRVGYLSTDSGRQYRYAVLFNTSKRDPVEVVRLLQRHLP